VHLPAEEAHHATRVLRLRQGHEVAVIDGAGRVARAVLEEGRDGGLAASILEVTTHPRTAPALAVYQGAAKGNKIDGLTERLGALGVAELRVFRSQRSVVSWNAPRRARLAERWQARARSAAKQSRNPWFMTTGPPLEWPELISCVAREDAAVVLWEEADSPLRAALDTRTRVALVVGPEGGISPGEAGELEAAGARLASLGPRILRTEDAAVVGVTGVLWHFGAIG
jgi:16S rRNA (uracil1498-N3)-methyltransferase